MSKPTSHPGSSWLLFRARTVTALTDAQKKSILRHPLAMEPSPVLQFLEAASQAEPLVVPTFVAVDHLHVGLCGASNAPGNVRAEHKAIGLILAELATRYPSRYIFSTADGLALALAAASIDASLSEPGMREGIAALAEIDDEQVAAAAVEAALAAAVGASRGLAGGNVAASYASDLDLSASGTKLWSYIRS